MLNTVLAVLFAAVPATVAQPLAERCELVRVALGNEAHGRPSLLKDSCVLENHFRDGAALVDVVMVTQKGKKFVRQPYLRHGEVCGADIVPVSLKKLPHKHSRYIHVMQVELRPDAGEKVRFEASLHVFDPDDPSERRGTIGIACGAEDDGVVEKKDGHWVVVKEKEPSIPEKTTK
jgi:hypothetical protein